MQTSDVACHPAGNPRFAPNLRRLRDEPRSFDGVWRRPCPTDMGRTRNRPGSDWSEHSQARPGRRSSHPGSADLATPTPPKVPGLEACNGVACGRGPEPPRLDRDPSTDILILNTPASAAESRVRSALRQRLKARLASWQGIADPRLKPNPRSATVGPGA